MLDGGGYGARGLCGNALLGDEANMHTLDPAKVHLDRIALHYAVLQWCSISYGERPAGGGRRREESR